MKPSPLPRRDSRFSGPDSADLAGGSERSQSLFWRVARLFYSPRPAARPAPFHPPPPRPAVDDPNANALLAFPSEATVKSEVLPITVGAPALPAPPTVLRPPIGPRLVRPALMAGAGAVVIVVVLLAIRLWPVGQSEAPTPLSGKLTINTRDIPSEVMIDGERRGASPLTVSLPPGAHTLTVRSDHDERVVPLTMTAGADVTQYFDLKAAAPAPALGQVFVTTDPPGARVAIDGRPQGTSPLTVSDLTANQHKVTVTGAGGSAERTIQVTAGSTASVVFSLSKVSSGPVGGWLSVSAPFDVQVLENDEVIGTSGASRIMLAAGSHTLLITNGSLGYQDTRKIDVAAGKTVSIKVDAPKASISVNARPWAEIVLDGNSVGQTPISNLMVSVGSHELVFKHPQLGERKQTVVVSANGPNRMAVDFTK
ncbi:MAG: PEGA domain-containing protein [Acidobacteriota bacterium]